MSNTVINPKPCSYNCGTRIFWDTVSNSYLEVFTKQKHICPNRNNNSIYSNKNNTYRTFTNNSVKPYQKQQKIPMSNSLELISGPIDSVQKKYEILSDLVTEFGGKTHGSQSHITGNNISLVVYYECPLGKRDEIKNLYNNRIRTLQNRFSV